LRKIMKRLSFAQAADATPTGCRQAVTRASQPDLHMTAILSVIHRNARAALALQGSARVVIAAIAASPAAAEVTA
jgi:hypothetical protein